MCSDCAIVRSANQLRASYDAIMPDPVVMPFPAQAGALQQVAVIVPSGV